MTTEIKVSTKKNVATITIDNPNSLNSINYQGWLTLASVAIDLGKSSDVRALIFTGSGNKSFSAGADIKEFPKTRYDTNTGMKYANALHNALDAIGSIRCPTISMIKGICMGGGCELAMTTDIRIATETSTFGIPVAKLGILLAYKESQRNHLWGLVETGTKLMHDKLRPQGLNIGVNEGQAAGAGVPQHLHVHIVPRWSGDTNFMATTGEVRVIPSSLEEMYSLYQT